MQKPQGPLLPLHRIAIAMNLPDWQMPLLGTAMILNQQKQEPRIKSDGQVLDIVDIFYTLQGEGPFTGHASIFIRLAGCNLNCPWCDTNYTEGRRTLMIATIFDLVSRIIREHPHTKLVVLTGGEPLRQNIVPLIHLLQPDIHVQIESNGVFEPSPELIRLIYGGFVTFIVSPKTVHISRTAAENASAFKYVISSDSVIESDGLPQQALGHPAKTHVARPPHGFKGSIYINPMDTKDDELNYLNVQACVKSSLKFGHICGLQAHKIWELP
jgi:organic radical activating enzyme